MEMMTTVVREMRVKLALDYILITGKNKNGCGYGWIKKSGPVEEIYSRNTFGRTNVCFAYFKRQFIPFIVVFEYMCGCFVVIHFWSKSIN
jgi:hypothetical protein